MAQTKYSEAISIQTFLAFLVVIIMFSSCQKNVTGDVGAPAPLSSTSFNVKTYSIDAPGGANGTRDTTTFNLTYDADNRLTSLISVRTTGDKIIYKYNSDNTFTMDVFESNVLSSHEAFYLNNIPFVDSTVEYDYAANDTITEKYIYNSNKQLVTLNSYRYSKLTGAAARSNSNFTYDNKGNVIKEVQGAVVTTYQYYPDLINNLSLTGLYFQQSKNLVKTTIETDGPLTMTTNYTYTFDSNNRITTEKRVFVGGETVIQTYTY